MPAARFRMPGSQLEPKLVECELRTGTYQAPVHGDCQQDTTKLPPPVAQNPGTAKLIGQLLSGYSLILRRCFHVQPAIAVEELLGRSKGSLMQMPGTFQKPETRPELLV